MRLWDMIARIIIYAAVFAALSNACTTINILKDRVSDLNYTDSALRSYSGQFVAEANKRHKTVDMNKLTLIFGNTGTKDNPHIVGTCHFESGYPIVIIDQRYWSVADSYEKEELVFHELGHCILYRDHCDIKDDGNAVTLMEPEMLGSYYFKNNREKLIDELFNPRAGCGQLSKNANGVNVCIHKPEHR